MFSKVLARITGKTIIQRSGDNSTSYQAEKIIVREVGLSVADAKEIALMVVEQNFMKFSEQAAVVAKARMEEMVNSYLAGITTKNPGLIDEVQDPGVQMALVAAQKEYVKTGDKDIAELLVNVLIERTAQPQRNLLQIILDESLAAIGKLTNSQLDSILLSFIVNNLIIGGYNTMEGFKERIKSRIEPLVSRAARSAAAYEHIESCGCGQLFGNKDFVKIFSTTYKGFFNKGMSYSELAAKLGDENLVLSDDSKYPTLFIKCFNNLDNFQLGFVTEENLIARANNFGLNQEVVNKLVEIFNEASMNEDEARQHLLGFGPYMNELFNLWTMTNFKDLRLNNIGKAIAVAAYKKEFKETLDLNLWIED